MTKKKESGAGVFTPKDIADTAKKHAKAMADGNSQRDLGVINTLNNLETALMRAKANVLKFNSNEDNLAVMRIIRSWFTECTSPTTVVHIPQKENHGYDMIEVIAIKEPMYFTELNGAGVLCGGDDKTGNSEKWDGVGEQLLHFQQWKIFPMPPGCAVRLQSDVYDSNGCMLYNGGQLATAPCVIRSYDDGHIGFGSSTGEPLWGQIAAAKKSVADGLPIDGLGIDVIVANNIRLLSAMRRFIDSFKGLTHLVGLKVKASYAGKEKTLRNEIRRFVEYDGMIRGEMR